MYNQCPGFPGHPLKQRGHESVDKYANIPIPQWDKFEAFSNDSPEGPSWETVPRVPIAVAHYQCRLYRHFSLSVHFLSFLVCFSWDHFQNRLSATQVLISGATFEGNTNKDTVSKFFPSSQELHLPALVHLSVLCPGVAFTGLWAGQPSQGVPGGCW